MLFIWVILGGSIPIAMLHAQVVHGNLGFEKGNFNGWQLSTGDIDPDNTNNSVSYGPELQGFEGDGFYLTSVYQGNDVNVNVENIPQLSKGRFSVRLGKNELNTGGSYYRLTTSFVVSPDSTLYMYRFATVLLEDLNRHVKAQKPGIDIEILDENLKPLSCSNFNAQLAGASTLLPNFKVQAIPQYEVNYLNWINAAVDLKQYVGKRITIRVTAHGCTERRHYGYLYFDSEFIDPVIKQLSACPTVDGKMGLKAPDGFGWYQWDNGANAVVSTVDAVLGKKYSVNVLPLFSIQNSCQLQIEHTIKFAKVDTTLNLTLCEGESTKIESEVFDATGQYIRHINRSNICDSTVTLNLKVNKIGHHSFEKAICEGESLQVGDSTYTRTGTYTTVINRGIFCDSIVVSKLVVDKKIEAEFGKNLITINKGDSLKINTGIAPSEPYTYLWTPASLVPCVNCPAFGFVPKRSELFTVYVTNPNQSCHSTDSLLVKVVDCAVHAPDIFTPNSDTHNNYFYVVAGPCVDEVLSFKIFDRWGEKLYSASNFSPTEDNFGWDGTYKGQKLQADVYPYQVVYRVKDTNKIITLRHAVTLVR